MLNSVVADWISAVQVAERIWARSNLGQRREAGKDATRASWSDREGVGEASVTDTAPLRLQPQRRVEVDETRTRVRLLE